MQGEATTWERVYGSFRQGLNLARGIGIILWLLIRTLFIRTDPKATLALTGLDPVTSKYGEIWDRMDRKAVQRFGFYIDPRAAGLALCTGAPAGEQRRLLTMLDRFAPDIEALLALSHKPFGEWPAMDSFDPMTGEHLRHPRAWFQNFARLLSADAAARWDQSDFDGAARRIAATVRWGIAIGQQPDAVTQMVGEMLLGQAEARLAAMIEGGLAQRLSPSASDDLRDAYTSAHQDGLDGALRSWVQLAQDRITQARECLADPQAGKRLATLARSTAGVKEDSHPTLGPRAPEWTYRCANALSWRLRRLNALSSTEISTKIERAQEMIAAIEQVALGRDGDDPASQNRRLEESTRAGVEEAALDPTHLSRWLLFSLGPSYARWKQSIEARQKVVEKLTPSHCPDRDRRI
ncbi:MAG: hypothetical protein AABZ53_12725 [Planctomycetota bacterium]